MRALAPPRPSWQHGSMPLLAALAVSLLSGAPHTAIATGGDAAALRQLIDDEWERWMRESPEWASSLGDRRYNDRWADESLAGIEVRDSGDAAALAALARLERARLDEADQLNAAVLQDVLEARRGRTLHKLHLLPLDPLGGVHAMDQFLDVLRFETAKDYDDWQARLVAYPVLVDQHVALLARGTDEGMVAPKLVLERVPPQIAAAIVDDASKSGLFRPFSAMPASMSPAQAERRRRAAKQAIAAAMPALRRLHEAVNQQLTVAPDAVGIGARKGGKEAYAFLVALHTTTSMTPDQIHALGLREVARIRKEMERVQQQLGFKGTLRDFFVHLRTDPKYFYRSPADILDGTRALAKRIDGRLVKVLKTMPRVPYGVEPVPDAIAPDTTTAYYSGPAADGSRAGTYYVNTYRPEMRPRWEMVPLCLHEAAPGHHTQIALAQELEGLPKLRTEAAHYTAFVEGWGLYAESLGDDMGLYDEPLDRMGQLAYEMWRAVRLVVDTGMHAKGWSREQAMQFFLDNAPKTELDVRNEVDRYISWPGQALAYKIGELKLKELRARAQHRLGERFSLGALHDVVLSQGPLPLSVVERRVDAWVAEQASQPVPARQ